MQQHPDAPTGGASTGQPADGQAITTTALCGAHRHGLCPGRILSATAADGQRCGCDCHAAKAAVRTYQSDRLGTVTIPDDQEGA